MSYTNSMAISELRDTDLDAVAAGHGFSLHIGNIAVGNTAVQLAENNQLNLAGLNAFSRQGGSQSNNNNAGNQSY